MPIDPFDQTVATAERLSGSLGELSALSRAFGTTLTGAFRGAALQGRELDDVLRSIAYSISNASLDRAFAPVTNGLSNTVNATLVSGFKSLLGFRDGGVFEGGRVVPFASGGVVARPTYFPLGGDRTGLMGEAGAEAILPLSRGSDGRLGVAARGEGARPVSVTVNVATPDVESFRRSQTVLQTQLARAVGRGRRGL